VFNYINDLKTEEVWKMLESDDEQKAKNSQVKQIINTVLSANRLILRDEMLHVSGGSELIQEFRRRKLIDAKMISEALSLVDSVVKTMIEAVDDADRSYPVLQAMNCITFAAMYGRKFSYDEYPCLSFVKAMIPSIDGFFRGSVTSYLNGDAVIIDDPIIE
jgi:hypothetical protein